MIRGKEGKWCPLPKSWHQNKENRCHRFLASGKSDREEEEEVGPKEEKERMLRLKKMDVTPQGGHKSHYRATR